MTTHRDAKARAAAAYEAAADHHDDPANTFWDRFGRGTIARLGLLVLGTGYRGTVEQLDAGARERVRAANLDFLARSGTRAAETNVLYAVARRP